MSQGTAGDSAAEARAPRSWAPRVYSPALDGVRAVAVGAVLLFHGGVTWVSGGFIGVDLFFVLSGFLIMRLLLDEWYSTGGLALRQFWLRRSRRLLPALLAVLCASAVVAILLDYPFPGQVGEDGLASLLYVSNWWFVVDSVPPSAAYSPSPFRHTWSLAIEEQWYLFLPLALLLLLPMVTRRRLLAAGLAGLALVSALWAAFLVGSGGGFVERVYYGTDTRVQALLVGAALAALGPVVASRRLTSAAFGSVVLIALALFTLSLEDPWTYRGGLLLVAVATVAVIAEVVASPSGVLARALSWAPLVAMGRISYGLYLWHWPVYVFLTEARTGLSGPLLLIGRLSLTFALAIASHRLLEQPIRHGALSRISPAARTAVIIGALVLTATLLVVVAVP